MIRDYDGNPLSEGARVEAWLDGVRYAATVKEIKPHAAGDGDFRRIVLIRDDGHVELQTFSDAVVVCREAS